MSRHAPLTIDEQKLTSVWDEHLHAEFEARSVDETLVTGDHFPVYQNKKPAILPGDHVNQSVDSAHAEKPVRFPRTDGSRIPFEVYRSPEIYQLEQERIFRGPTWSFVALEAEIPHPHDFKSTFVGDTPIVRTRNDDGSLSAWVNRWPIGARHAVVRLL